MKRLEFISPITVFVIVLVVVFGVEMCIMLLVELLDLPRVSRLLLPLLDAAILVLVLWPLLWFLVVRPMRRTLAQRREFLSRMLTIQEEERAALARDLHDELGQAQTAVLLGSRSILKAATLDDAKEGAGEVARMAASMIESSRRIARGLSPGVLLDLGLAVAADRLCEDMAGASGVAIERSIRLGEGRLPPEVEIAAYRVLQEAMNNAVKHGAPSRVRVLLERSGESLRLEVADDGVGLPTGANRRRAGGFGIEGMRQRVTLRNGDFSIRPAVPKGTIVTASFPLAADPTVSIPAISSPTASSPTAPNPTAPNPAAS